MHGNGHAAYRLDARGVELSGPTVAGLVAAGVDMDAIEAEALVEHEARAHARLVAMTEARTGISDRTAAALADVATLREQAQIINRLSDVDRFDRIERALRQQ